MRNQIPILEAIIGELYELRDRQPEAGTDFHRLTNIVLAIAVELNKRDEVERSAWGGRASTVPPR